MVTMASPSDRDLLFHRLYLLPRVCDVAPHLFGRKTHRNGVVVDDEAEDRYDEDVPAERNDPYAREVFRAEVGDHPQTDEVRPQPRGSPPVEVRSQFRRVDNMAYAEEHEAEGHRDEHLPDDVPVAPVDDQVRQDEGEGRQHLAGR